MTNKTYLSNDNLRGLMAEIVRQIGQTGFRPDYIMGVQRGGLTVAVCMSHYFNVPMVTAAVSLRDHVCNDPLSHVIKLLKDGKRVLMVDDICDQGHTLDLIWRELYENCGGQAASESEGFNPVTVNLRSAVLVHNLGQDAFEPDFIGMEIDKSEKNTWVVFPFEEWWK